MRQPPTDGLGDLHARHSELLSICSRLEPGAGSIIARRGEDVWTRAPDHLAKSARGVTGSNHRIDSQARFWPVGATRLPPQAVRSRHTFQAIPLPTVVAVLLLTSAAAESWRRSRVSVDVADVWFSVSWAGTRWQPDPAGTLTAVGPERLDRIHLLNGVSSLYFEGATRYQGDLTACVAEEANLLAQETGVSEIRPYRDEEGVQLIADGPNSSAAALP